LTTATQFAKISFRRLMRRVRNQLVTKWSLVALRHPMKTCLHAPRPRHRKFKF